MTNSWGGVFGYFIAFVLFLLVAVVLLLPPAEIRLPDSVKPNNHARGKHPAAIGSLENNFNCLVKDMTKWLYLEYDPNDPLCPKKQHGVITTPGDNGKLITVYKALSRYWKDVMNTME